MVTDLPDFSCGIFATPRDLGAVTSDAARASAGRRAGLQAKLLQKFPEVSLDEFRRMLLRCPRCEHAISVGKFLQTQSCTQCACPIINPNGMFAMAFRAMTRMGIVPTEELINFLKEIPRV